jgi:hypothetical protein
MDGEKIRVEGKNISVAVDFTGTIYQVRQGNLEYVLPLSEREVTNGGKLKNIPTPWRPIVFTIPPLNQIGGIARLAGIGWPIKTKSSDLTENERKFLEISPSAQPFWLSAPQLKAIKKVGKLYIRTELVENDDPRQDWNPYSSTTLLLKT